MRWLWPSGLAGRVAIVLTLALITVQLSTLPFFLRQQASAAASLYQSSTVDRVGHIIKLFEPLSPEQRRQLMPVINSPALSVELFFELSAQDREAVDEAALADSLALKLNREVIIKRIDQQEPGLLDIFPSQQRIAIWIPLADDSWLRFSTSSGSRSQGWVAHISAQLVMVCLVMVFIAVLAARQITRPIRTFVHAAERLGTDVNAQPIAEKGSRELRRATRVFNTMQLRLQRYVEDRTRMLAAISHDLRTSLTRLRLRTEFIEDEQQRHKAQLDLEQMDAMLASTLSFARDDADHEEPLNVDIAKLLHTLCDDMADLGKTVTYTGPESLVCTCRPLALSRAAANVVSNAVDYGREAHVSLEQLPQHIEIRVDDAGPGIPEEHMEQAFEPFMRLDKARNRSVGGTGLGLSITRSVMRSHGGDVLLVNGPEGGLRVTLQLPI